MIPIVNTQRHTKDATEYRRTIISLSSGRAGSTDSIPNATAGMLSVRPHLAGTASGLGSFFMIGGGAALSVVAGVVIKFGSGSLALLLLMSISVVLGFLSAWFVVWREKQLARS